MQRDSVTARSWSPGLVFHDPLADSPEPSRDGALGKLRKAPRPQQRRQQSDRKQVKRREALEALSLDLAVLALSRSTRAL